MTTGQTEKLSNLEHPSFELRPQLPSSDPHVDTPTPTPSPAPPSRRKSSFAALAFRRRSSLTPSKNPASSSVPSIPTLIAYPGSRLETPSWVRDIISKMLIANPLKRAELIEVAAKVPKEILGKATRPLMEVAWLDYKEHVGPLAGLGGDGEGEGVGWGSEVSSVYSGVSSMSNSFAALLGGGKIGRAHV